jgi:anti-sigma B factor antagonist
MAHFEIQSRAKEGITILDLRGRLAVGEPCTLLREQVDQQLTESHDKLILNLKHVDYIDSTGLGTMVICFTRLQKAGGALKLVNLNRRNIELLLLTKLSTVMQIFGDEQEAVNSFFPEREIKHFDILNFIQQQKESEQAS